MIADGIPVRIPVSAALDDLRGVAGTLALAEQLRGLHVATVLLAGTSRPTS